MGLKGIASFTKKLVTKKISNLPSVILGDRRLIKLDEDQEKTLNGSLIFPPELRNTKGVNLIEFTARSHEEGHVELVKIYLPCPQNIIFNDNASFNTINLGVIGGALRNALDSSNNVSDFTNNIVNQAKGIVNNFKAMQIGAAALSILPSSDQIKQQALFGAKVVVNPNTNTTFTGSNIRIFNFTFKLIAHSEGDANTIRNIHHIFRSHMYPDSKTTEQKILLSFPPIWNIKFRDKTITAENSFIPKIYDCYLVSLDTSFNSSANMFHYDGAPFEVDITLNFQESRALTKTDIKDLRPPTVNFGEIEVKEDKFIDTSEE